ncbi:MAG: hypothetical protein AAF267_08705 [Deinococcota bacterium]
MRYILSLFVGLASKIRSLKDAPTQDYGIHFKNITVFIGVLTLLMLAQSSGDGGVRQTVELPIQGGGSVFLSRGVRSSPLPSAMALPYGQPKRPEALSISRISFYQAVRAQTDDDPHTAACGRNIGPWVQIAVSRDLLQYFPCRSLVRIELDRPVAGVEWFDAIVYDTMNPRFRNTVDVLVSVREPARAYGVTTGTLYYVTR